MLEHDDFVLTESSAILKYLADLTDSPAYPKDLRKRAHVNEVMDFFNTYMMRDYVYGLVYSRVLSHYRLNGAAHAQYIALHEPRAARRLKALDTWIGTKTFICGDSISIADYFGSGIRLGRRTRRLRSSSLGKRDAMAQHHEVTADLG